MPLTNFVALSTVIRASWLNAVDRLLVTVFGEASTKEAARTAISAVGTVDTIAHLRLVLVANISDLDTIEVLGHTTAGSGGGTFYWNASSADADDNGITILPTGHVGNGRWKRMYFSLLESGWFGTTGSLEFRTSAQAALDAGGFWLDDVPPGKVDSISGRLLVGDAVNQNGELAPGTEKTWVGNEASGNMTYFDSRSQSAIYSINGGIALATASRSSDNARTGELNTIGHGSYAVNDNTNAADKKSVWAYYGHAHQKTANDFTAGIELDVCSVQTLASVDPYAMDVTGSVACAWLGVGGETAQGLISGGYGASLTNVSCALGIINSASSAAGNRYEKGIVFHASSIAGTDGTTGTGVALQFAKGHEITWKHSSGANAFAGKIRSDVSSAADHQRIVFENGSLNIKGVQADLTTEVKLFSVTTHATAANYLRTTAAATGSGPSLESVGSDSDVSLIISSKGTGAVNIRTRASGLTQFQVVDVASAVNNLQVGGSATGVAPYVTCSGSDTDIDIALTPKGTGIVKSFSSLLLHKDTAMPAGGTAGAGLRFSSTSNFGVFFGSGAPTLSAAKGSLYLRSDGSTTNDRAYINTNGSTTWTALTTVA